jgi:hypothetical protein
MFFYYSKSVLYGIKVVTIYLAHEDSRKDITCNFKQSW